VGSLRPHQSPFRRTEDPDPIIAAAERARVPGARATFDPMDSDWGFPDAGRI